MSRAIHVNMIFISIDYFHFRIIVYKFDNFNQTIDRKFSQIIEKISKTFMLLAFSVLFSLSEFSFLKKFYYFLLKIPSKSSNFSTELLEIPGCGISQS